MHCLCQYNTYCVCNRFLFLKYGLISFWMYGAGAGTFCPEPEPELPGHFTRSRSRSRNSFPEPEPSQSCTVPHPWLYQGCHCKVGHCNGEHTTAPHPHQIHAMPGCRQALSLLLSYHVTPLPLPIPCRSRQALSLLLSYQVTPLPLPMPCRSR